MIVQRVHLQAVCAGDTVGPERAVEVRARAVIVPYDHVKDAARAAEALRSGIIHYASSGCGGSGGSTAAHGHRKTAAVGGNATSCCVNCESATRAVRACVHNAHLTVRDPVLGQVWHACLILPATRWASALCRIVTGVENETKRAAGWTAILDALPRLVVQSLRAHGRDARVKRGCWLQLLHLKYYLVIRRGVPSDDWRFVHLQSDPVCRPVFWRHRELCAACIPSGGRDLVLNTLLARLHSTQ